MNRAHLYKARADFVLEQVPIPEAPKGGLVIKTVYSGICHSDVNQWKDELDFGDKKVTFSGIRYNFPVVLGHEIAGVVHSIGEEPTNDLKVGDRVVIYPWRGCNNCGFCNKGFSNQCGKQTQLRLGAGRPGGFSSYVVVPECGMALKCPETLGLDVGCMLTCSGLTTYNAVEKAKQAVQEAHDFEGQAAVLLVGAGGLGLWCLQIARAVFPPNTRIVVADITDEKLQVARERGCDDTVVWSRGADESSLLAETCEKGYKGGYNAVIDLVNNKVTAARDMKCLRPFGTIVMVGLFGGAVDLSLPYMVTGCRQIRGVLVGTIQQLRDLVALVDKNKLIPPPMIYYKLDQITEAMTTLLEGRMQGRGVIKHE